MLVPYFLILGLFVGQSLAQQDWTWEQQTFLDNFVNRIDPEFDPNVDEILYYNNTDVGCHTYVLNFTSGRWMDASYSTQPLWWHYLTIHIPVNPVHYDSGILFIEGGSMGGPPDNDDTFVQALCIAADSTGAVTALLKQIPNQDITFVDDPFQEGRGEDDLIAYTWRDFVLLHDNIEDYVEADYERILQFPMARAGVRALDVMNVFSKKKLPGSDLQKFTVAGGSKRGWAAWVVAATDQRIDIMVPLVISIQNVVQNLHHSYENLGDWTFAFADYWAKNITQYLDDPRIQLAFDQIDGYSYRSRLNITKMIGCATGDEFFQPDDSWDFYDDLLEPKYMLMMENAEHSLIGSYVRVLNAMIQVFKGVRFDGPENMPKITWTMDEDETGGNIYIETDRPPLDRIAFHGDSVPDVRRDFRIIALDGLQLVYWNETEDADWTVVDDTHFSVHYNRSDDTPYRAFLVKLVFPGNDGFYDFTTECNVIPWERPFPPCSGFNCTGGLI